MRVHTTLALSSLLLALPGLAGAATLHCATPEVLSGVRVIEAPMVAPEVARDGGKVALFQPLDGRLDGKNVTIQWNPGDGDEAMAGVLIEALEAAWQSLVVDLGWLPPISTDTYLLTVVLDSSIGASGLTGEVEVDGFPDGVPIIWMNPDNADLDAFFRSVAAHELHHAIQYRYRGSWSSQDAEAWYWEASAEWGAELALPGLDQYAASAGWFTQAPWRRFDSQMQYHAYGMFLLNAWLAEDVGPGTMRAVWEAAGDGDPWDELVADVVDAPAVDVWAGFVNAVAEGTLPESDLYAPVAVTAELMPTVGGDLPALGARYYLAPAAGTLTVEEGDVLLTAPGGSGASLDLDEGDIVAALAPSDDGGYVLAWETGAGDDDDDDDDGGQGCAGCRGGNGLLPVVLLPALPVMRRRRR